MLKDRELQMIVDSAQDISLELGLLKDKEAFLKKYLAFVWFSDARQSVKEDELMDFEKFEKKEYFVNRELSWLKFDERVLSEARDKNLPLFDRLKFLSITASNLDEFFMVRVASLKDQVHAGYHKTDIAGMTAKEQLKEISVRTHELVHVQYNTLNRSLIPALEKAGMHLVAAHENLTEAQSAFVDRYLRIMYIRYLHRWRWILPDRFR